MIDTLNVLGVCWFRQNQGSPHTYSEAFLPGREWQSVGWRLCVQGRSRELLGRSQRPSQNTKREGFWARVPPCSWKAQWEHRPRVSHCTLTRGSKSGSQRPPSSLGLQLSFALLLGLLPLRFSMATLSSVPLSTGTVSLLLWEFTIKLLL